MPEAHRGCLRQQLTLQSATPRLKERTWHIIRMRPSSRNYGTLDLNLSMRHPAKDLHNQDCSNDGKPW